MNLTSASGPVTATDSLPTADPNKKSISGVLTSLIRGNNGSWNLTVGVSSPSDTSSFNWQDFVGGTISIAGGANVPITVVTVQSSTQHVTIVFTTAALKIPFKLVDDDVTLMPTMPDTSYLAAAYADAYILPIVDGGQGCNHNDNSCIHNSNNKMNVAFQLNNVTTPVQVITTAISVADALESDSNRVNDFWIAYVLAAYQPASDPTQNAGGGQRDDNDPNDPDLQNPQNLQSPLGGVTNGLSGSGALVFIETLRDQDNSYGYVVPSIPRVVAHEIAHQCGLPDRDANQPGIHGLMTFELYNNANIRFNSDDIAMLKARVKSCGVMP